MATNDPELWDWEDFTSQTVEIIIFDLAADLATGSFRFDV